MLTNKKEEQVFNSLVYAPSHIKVSRNISPWKQAFNNMQGVCVSQKKYVMTFYMNIHKSALVIFMFCNFHLTFVSLTLKL